MKKSFNKRERQALGRYVYRLIDPRNGETFYVGQGRDDRVFQHVREAESMSNSFSIA